jgi:hypothetical protein
MPSLLAEPASARSTLWAQLASLARLAPSPHNTQPFRIQPRNDDWADIVLIADRLLPREDHGNRYVASAFGIFAETLVRAGIHFGIDVRVSPDPLVDPARLDRSGPVVHVGEATIRGTRRPHDQARLLEARRTSRLPYDGRLIDPSTLHSFSELAGQYGHRFIVRSDEATVREILRLNVDAIIDNLRLDDEREEIRPWYRAGETPAFGDGLWERPMNQPAWMMRAAFERPRVVGWAGVRRLARWNYLRTQSGTRHVGLLCGPFTRWRELVNAGELLMNLWLAMTESGISMQPMGSMLTNADYARAIASRFGVDDCWLAFRCGYGPTPPRAPRLAGILIEG